MTGPEMMMDGGPMISGTWMHQRTGETITVRDSYNDGNEMYVILTNGRTMSMDEFQNYVQMSDDEYDDKGNKIGTAKPASTPQKPASTADASLVFAGMDVPEPAAQADSSTLAALSEIDPSLAGTGESSSHDSVKPQQSQATGSNTVYDMINKILEKSDTPKFSFNIEWIDYPKAQLQMLKDYFDVTDSDIAKAVIKRYVRLDTVKEAVEQWIIENQEK